MIGLVDSQTTVVAAGGSFAYEWRSKPNDFNIYRIHFGLAYQLDILSIGIDIKYQSATHTASLNAAPNPVAGFIFPYGLTNHYDALTGDVGATLTPISQLTIAAVGYNLIPKGHEGYQIAPRALGLGAALKLFGLGVDADALIDFDSLKTPANNFSAKAGERYHFGAEYAIADMIPVRGGFIVDRLAMENYWSVGAGYKGSGLGIDLGLREAISQPSNRYISVAISLAM